jgi:autotransporter-associated beta strand protein
MNKSLASVRLSSIEDKKGVCLVAKLFSQKQVALLVACAAFSLSGQCAQASSYTWNSTSTPSDWSTSSNWNGAPPSGGPSAAGDVDTINTNITANTTINLYNTGDAGTATKTVGALNIGDTDGGNTFTIAAGTGGGSLILNSNGAVGGAQINELSTAKGDTISAAVQIADANGLTVANASGNTFLMSGGITSSGAGNLVLSAGAAGGITLSTNAINNAGTITNSGSGAGTTTITGGVGSNVTAITENSTTSALTITTTALTVNGGGTTLTNSLGTKLLTVSGGITGSGNLILNNNSSLASGITLSTTSVNNGGSITISGSGSGSTLISAPIGSSVGAISDTGANSLTLSGATVANNGNITFSGTGSSAVTFSATAINTVGSITNNGTTAGTTTISGAIGSGVTSITENSGSSTLNLSGANTAFDGSINLTSGTLSVSSATALGGNGSATGSGGTLSIAAGTVLNSNTANTVVTTVNAENWAGSFEFYGSDALNLGTGAITMAAPLTLTVNSNTLTVNGTISGTANGVFDITKAGTGTLVIGENIALSSTETLNPITGVEQFSGIISDGGHGYGLTLANGGTLNLAGADTYSGPTMVSSGTLIISGSSGSVADSAVTVAGATLTFSDTAVGVTGATRASSVTLNGPVASNLTVTAAGNTGANTIDTITGALSFGAGASGASTVSLTPNTTTTPMNTQLDAGSLSIAAGSTVLFRGTSLGADTIASQTGGTTNIKFNTTPTLLGGGGAAGSTTISIIAGALGDTLATGNGFDSTGGLVTYGANGVRVLSSSEYLPIASVAAGQTTLNNVQAINSSGAAATYTFSSTGTTTINSLSLLAESTGSSITVNGTDTLKIDSGVIYGWSSGTGDATHPMIVDNNIDLDGNEGYIFAATVAQSGNGGVGGSDLQLAGVISDDGGNGVTLGGSGITAFAGTVSNTYTGVTTVNSGVLELDKTGGAVAIPGNLVLNAGAVEMPSTSQFASTSNVTVNGGTLDFRPANNSGSGTNQTFSGLIVNGGSTNPGTNNGSVTVINNVLITGGTVSVGSGKNGSLSIGGNLSFTPSATTAGTLTINTSATGGTHYYSTLYLTGNLNITNTASGAYTPITIYAGTTTVNGGALYLSANSGINFTGNGTNSNTTTIAAPTGTGPLGVIELNGANIFNIGDGAAAVDLEIDATLINGGTNDTASGVTKNGAGTLLLTAANTYTDGTILNAGTLEVSGAGTLGNQTNLAQAGLTVNGGLLDLGGTTQIVDTVSVTGNSTIQDGNLEADDAFNGQSFAFSNSSGTTATVSANLKDSSVSVPLTMSGTGTLVLSGTNTYSGGSTLSAGTTLLSNTSGSATGSGALSVTASATLAGKGESSGTSFSLAGTGTATGSRAIVLVGQNSPSDTNTASTLTLIGSSASSIADANLTFNINDQVRGGLGTDPTNSGNELVVGSTPITFALGVRSTILTLNVQNIGIIAANTPYVLVAGLTAGGADQYTNLSLGTPTGSLATGLITPILNSNFGGTGNVTLSMSGLAAGYYGGNSYLFLYQNSTTGADDIEVEVVPEPGTWAMMLGGLAMLVGWQRRRRS